MVSVDIELVLVGLVAMLEPATLISSVLALALGERPLRTGFWFFAGGFGVTMACGVAAAFVLGDRAASHTAEPKTWVAILNIAAGSAIALYVLLAARRPADPDKTAANVAKMRKLTDAHAPAIVAAGAVLANAGVFMIVAIKAISQLDPTTLQYILDWTLFALASLLPLAVGLLLLVIVPSWTKPKLAHVHAWMERHARTVAGVVMLLLAASLLRDGVAGLTS
jgi:hypothetical protein